MPVSPETRTRSSLPQAPSLSEAVLVELVVLLVLRCMATKPSPGLRGRRSPAAGAGCHCTHCTALAGADSEVASEPESMSVGTPAVAPKGWQQL